MEMQVLTPAMQYREETDFHPQTFGVAGDGKERLSGGAEEDVVDDFFVVEGDVGDGFGEREDHMEVLHGQQLGLPLLQPFGAGDSLALGAMAVTAGAVLNVGVLAVVAPFDSTAQRGRAASLNGLHQAMLVQGQWMSLPVGGAVLPKDVGQLQGWRRHGLALGVGLGLGWLPEPFERADGAGDGVRRNRGIARRGVDPGVAQ